MPREQLCIHDTFLSEPHFLTFPEIEAEIFLTSIGVKEVDIICYKSLIIVNQDYQKKFRSL